jgi:hypothetical protein
VQPEGSGKTAQGTTPNTGRAKGSEVLSGSQRLPDDAGVRLRQPTDYICLLVTIERAA